MKEQAQRLCINVIVIKFYKGHLVEKEIKRTATLLHWFRF